MKISWRVVTWFALLGAVPSLAAAPLSERIALEMEAQIKARELAGVVTLVADAEKVLHLAADGFSNLEKSVPMTPDTVFWIASMTKPITATAVMMMQDEQRLSVKDEVSKFLPEFRDLKDAAGNPVTITIEQCLTHSSGLSELSGEELRACRTLADLSPLIAAKPVKFSPGEKWEYCQTGINLAARIVEVVSGKTFPEFLQERLFGPLEMVDTSFYPGASQVARMVTPYRRSSDGGLEAAEFSFLHGASPSDDQRVPMANGGLFSTAADYAKFAQMILSGGESQGKRLVSESGVRQMTGVQSGELRTGFTPGNAWGLGWCVVREPQGVSAALSPGSYGHGGLYGTQAWIDPVKKRIYLLLIQRADMANSDASEARRIFQNAAANES
jgi:CubicO group peptidase (beta-lactamase class C family)